MSTPSTTQMDIDTGQTGKKNKNFIENYLETNQELSKIDNYNEQQTTLKKSQQKGLLLEIEYWNE